MLSDYVALTKPKVQSLLLFTTVCAMFIAGTPSAWLVLATVIGGYLTPLATGTTTITVTTVSGTFNASCVVTVN